MEITGHRDHDLLNISVISALSELTHASRARVLDVLHVGERIFVKAQITIADGKLEASEEHLAHLVPEVPVEQLPKLATGLTQQHSVIEDLDEQGNRTIWLPIWMNEKVNVCLEIFNPAVYSDNTSS